MDKKPNFFAYPRTILGFTVVTGTILFDFLLVMKGMPPENHEAVLLLAGGLNTLSAGVIGYYFGSSKDKSDAEQARTLVETQTATK